MKTLTTYAKYFTPISKITFLFCFLLGNIAEANTKRANFSPSLGIKRTYTYTFEGSSDMIASATTPELIFFLKQEIIPLLITPFSAMKDNNGLYLIIG